MSGNNTWNSIGYGMILPFCSLKLYSLVGNNSNNSTFTITVARLRKGACELLFLLTNGEVSMRFTRLQRM